MKNHYGILAALIISLLLSQNILVNAEEVKDDVYVPWNTGTEDPEVDPGEIIAEPLPEEEKIDTGKTEDEIKALINKIKVDHAPDPLKVDIGTSDINYYYTSARLKEKETIDISKDNDDAKLIILSALRQYKSWLVNNSVIGSYNSNSDTEMRFYDKISKKTTSYSKFNKVKTIAVNDTTDGTSLYINYNTGECFSIVSLKGEKESDTKTSCVIYYTLPAKDLKVLHDVFEGKELEEEDLDEEPIEGLPKDEESDLTHKSNVPLANILFIIFIILIVGGVMFFLIVKIKAFMMDDSYEEEDDDEDDEDDEKEVNLFGKEKDENAFDESEYKR
ncbi:MAG: hypothetical protein MJ246_00115 [Clostridia bacterium]|nr:hypothetical protein [Clostridia bacterium]